MEFIRKYIFIILPVLIVVSAILVVLLSFLRQGQPPASQPPSVVLAPVVEKEIVQKYEYIGQLEADKIVELQARVKGELVNKPFKPGHYIPSGQPAFQIERKSYQADVNMAKANESSALAQFTKAQQDFNRISDLYAKKTSSKSDYDASKAAYEIARANLDSARAQVDQANINLSYTDILTPFDGEISDSPFSVGSIIGPESGTLATFVSLDPILVTFSISDRIVSQLNNKYGANYIDKSNQDAWTVSLKLSNKEIYDLKGSLTYMAPLIDRNTDTIKFKAKFDNPDRKLLPGQTVIVIMERKLPSKMLIVPKISVMTDTNGRYVYVPKQMPADDTHPEPYFVTEKRPVTIGEEFEKEYEIASGLNAGEQVIELGLLSGGSMINEGTVITIKTLDEVKKEQQVFYKNDAQQGESK